MAVPKPNPLNRKITRLAAENVRVEGAIATSRRELSKLREEREELTRACRSYLCRDEDPGICISHSQADVGAATNCSGSLRLGPTAATLTDGSDAGEALEEKIDSPAVLVEISQLQEELQRLRKAQKVRTERSAAIVVAFREELKCRDAEIHRMCGASKAMDISRGADLEELVRLHAEENILRDEAEMLEAKCLKSNCQAAAWRLRTEAERQQAVELDKRWLLRESDLQAELDKQTALVERITTELSDANANCVQLKALNASPGLQSDIGHRERGTQTRYISEHMRLREQVQALTDELEVRTRRSGDAGENHGRTSPQGTVAQWMSLCLRPESKSMPRPSLTQRAPGRQPHRATSVGGHERAAAFPAPTASLSI